MKHDENNKQVRVWTSKEYAEIEAMDSFNTFVKKKNTFLFSMTFGFLFFYILLPILAFRPVLQQKVFGNITGVWLYSGALFIMTVVMATIYIKKASTFDKQAAQVMAEYNAKGGN